MLPLLCLMAWQRLRNAAVIAQPRDCEHLDDEELIVSKTLRSNGTAMHQRLGSVTKSGKTHVVQLSQQVVVVLRKDERSILCVGLNIKDCLVFVTPRPHGHLYA